MYVHVFVLHRNIKCELCVNKVRKDFLSENSKQFIWISLRFSITFKFEFLSISIAIINQILKYFVFKYDRLK